MHMPSHPAAQPVSAAQQFAQDLDRIDAAHTQRRAGAVIEGHRVALAQLRHHARDDRFFSRAQMHLT